VSTWLDAFNQVDTETLMQLASGRKGKYSFTSGLYRNTGLRQAYRAIFKGLRIEDLSPRTMLYATDITTGEGVMLERGEVADAVEASGALYPIMPPVEIDGRCLADGNYHSPLPILEAVKRNADLILLIYVVDPVEREPRNFLDSFLNMAKISSYALLQSQLLCSIDMHNYEILVAPVHMPRAIFPWDVEHLPAVVAAGRQTAQEKLPEFLGMRDKFRQCEANFLFESEKKGRGAP